MVSRVELAQMDDPVGHIDHRLLDPNTFVRPATDVPLRHEGQTFREFNNNQGGVMIQGSANHQFDNPRIFSKLNYSYKAIDVTTLFINIFILDRDDDAVTYEILGEHDEIMYDDEGRALFKTWYFGPRDRTGVRYPVRWQGYFCRPVMYLSCGMGKFDFDVFNNSKKF